MNRAGQRSLQARQKTLDAVGHADNVRSRLPLDIQDHCRLRVHPRGLRVVFRAVNYVSDIRQANRPAILVSHDQRPVGVAGQQLIVSLDRELLPRPVQRSFRLVDVCRSERRAQILQAQPVRRERRRIRAHPHRRFLPAANRHQAHARKLRNLLREIGIRVVLDLCKRQRIGRQRQRQNRRVRRIHLAVDGRVWQVSRQIRRRRIDGRLHFLLGHVDVFLQIELQRDQRSAERARRRHLRQPRHFAELPLERRGHGRRHHVRTRARIKRQHLNRRVINLRKRRYGKLEVTDRSRQEHAHHQQRSRDRADDERPGNAHGVVPVPAEELAGEDRFRLV